MAEADVKIKSSRDRIATLEREKDELHREQLERDEVSFTLYLYFSNGWCGRRNQGF